MLSNAQYRTLSTPAAITVITGIRNHCLDTAVLLKCVGVHRAQSCPALCIPWTVAHDSSVHGIFQTSTGVSWYFLLQGIFPTQRSNPRLLCLLHWQAGSLPAEPTSKYTKVISSCVEHIRGLVYLRRLSKVMPAVEILTKCPFLVQLLKLYYFALSSELKEVT